MADIQTKLLEDKAHRAIRARIRFKALIRQVIYNRSWLCAEDEEEDIEKIIKKKTGVKKPFQLKKRGKHLTLRDKALLRTPYEYRTDKEKMEANKIIGNLKCFRMYPEEIQEQLVGVSFFEYYGPNRILIKEDQEAVALYFILSGEVIVTRRDYDPITNEWGISILGKLLSGNMFGEVSLLHGVKRTATVTTVLSCELLVLRKEDFNRILKSTMMQRWEEIHQSMNKLKYFDNWDTVSIRECCIVAKMKNFQAGEIILGDGMSRRNQETTYFIIDGSCTIIEDIKVQETLIGSKTFYKLYNDGRLSSEVSLEARTSSELTSGSKYPFSNTSGLSGRSNKIKAPSTMMESNSSDTDIKSINKSTITMRQLPSIFFYKQQLQEQTSDRSSLELSQQKTLPDDVHVEFLQIATMRQNALFTSEQFKKNRRIVADTSIKCLLIPTYWLAQKNKNNIWTRLEYYVSKAIPSTQTVYRQFLENRKWLEYKKKIRQSATARNLLNTTTIHDVPYLIRVMSDY